MSLEELGWEIGKLVVQAGTAFAIARLAVRWALGRFKQEKIWERRLYAQAEILVALSEMRRLYGRWVDEMEHTRAIAEDVDLEYQERFRSAARKLEEATPLAQFLLSNEASAILIKLEQDREKVFTGDRYNDYNVHYGLLDDAIVALVADGRQLLQ